MSKFLFLVILTFLFALNSLYGDVFDFRLNGNGARATGLGGAFAGIADDATAISWNPAGLTQLYKMEGSVIGRFAFGSGSVDGFKDFGIDSWNFDVNSSFQLNFASFIIPFSVGEYNVVGGIAYRKMYDFTSEITQTIKTTLGEFEIYDNVEGGINAISPSIGFQISDLISVGTTINILTGTEAGDGYDDIDNTEYEYEIDYSGTAIDVGFLMKPSPQFSIGGVLNLPHTRTAKAEGEELKIDVPMFFTIGAAFRATDKLLLAFDYRNQPISKAKVEGEELDLLEDLNSIHAGLEYLAGSGEQIIPIRLGFYTEPSPFTDANDDQVVDKVFTAGTGIVLNNLIFDASFEWIMSSIVLAKTDNNEITLSGNGFRFTVGAIFHLAN